uniref:Uncharacterized protein n=1 Tax=Daphnia galeata TaxID=27404 RepID=A0A8J2S591_9CRUS|nr:unnamed protein product [Daphnia galeata]
MAWFISVMKMASSVHQSIINLIVNLQIQTRKKIDFESFLCQADAKHHLIAWSVLYDKCYCWSEQFQRRLASSKLEPLHQPEACYKSTQYRGCTDVQQFYRAMASECDGALSIYNTPTPN